MICDNASRKEKKYYIKIVSNGKMMILLIVEVGFWWQNVRIRTRTHKHMHSYTNSLVFSANEITHICLLLSRLGYVTTKFLMAIMLPIV